jgi:hypothetical protein
MRRWQAEGAESGQDLQSRKVPKKPFRTKDLLQLSSREISNLTGSTPLLAQQASSTLVSLLQLACSRKLSKT